MNHHKFDEGVQKSAKDFRPDQKAFDRWMQQTMEEPAAGLETTEPIENS